MGWESLIGYTPCGSCPEFLPFTNLFTNLKMEVPTILDPSAPHPLLNFFRESSTEEWTVEFNHPTAEIFKEKFATFYHEGSIYGANITFKLKDKSGKSISCGSILEPNMPRLLENSGPSSFGRGDHTVYDEEVRKGRELCPDKLEISMYSSLPNTEIRQALFPNASEISLVFSKMAIYENGGHFHVHRDTVRSHDHQGTLLIEVRSPHTGGDMVLEHNGEEIRWTLSCSDLESKLTDMVQYIAFYTDVNHRVEPVTSGVRAVLQYDIYIRNDDDPQSKKAKLSHDYRYDDNGYDDDDSENFFQKTKTFSTPITDVLTTKLLESLDKYVTDEQSISFPHFHLYTDTQLHPNRLKLKDKQIFTALLNHGYHVQLIPVTIRAVSDYDGMFARNSDYSIRPLSSTLDGYVLKDGSIIVSKMKEPATSVMYLATGYEKLIQLDYTSHCEYTGNEAAPAEYRYFQSVFVVNRVKQET